MTETAQPAIIPQNRKPGTLHSFFALKFHEGNKDKAKIEAAMQKCDCNIIEFSEKGVGLGINAGYCYAIGKPIFIIAKTGSDISTTISNLATKIIFYDQPKDLIKPFKEIVKDFTQ